MSYRFNGGRNIGALPLNDQGKTMKAALCGRIAPLMKDCELPDSSTSMNTGIDNEKLAAVGERCYNCEGYGHYARECRRKGKSDKGKDVNWKAGASAKAWARTGAATTGRA